jgi:Cd2+/Zn2+-exporting ATPase
MAQTRSTFKVRGLDCPVEAAELRRALEGSPGVFDLGFDLPRGTMTVRYDPSATDPSTLVGRVAEGAGMMAEAVGVPESADAPTSWWGRNGRLAATVASGLLLAVGVAVSWSGGGSWAKGAYALAVVAGSLDLLPRAVRALRERRLDIHVLMALAVIGAAWLDQWDEAATVAFLFGLSELLETLSLEHARRAIRGLLEVAPETAELVGEGGEVRIVPAADLLAGDLVRIRAGERVPIDGTVVEGRSGVDQKSVTGESVPVDRGPGDPVYAGTVNGEGGLEVRASGPLGESVVTRLMERVRAAQAGRAPVQRSVERFAAIYTPAVVGVSLATALGGPLARLGMGLTPAWADWFSRALIVLVAACPCALVIATPVALVSAMAAAARRGVLVKGGQFLEAIGRIKVLAFDKTGTLTLGEPAVVDVVAADGHAGDDVLRIAAALGDRGGHVLGRAIARHARHLRLDVPSADEYLAVPGLGAIGRVDAQQYRIGSHRYIDESGQCEAGFHERLALAEGPGTPVALTDGLRPMGWITLADEPRPEAAAVLAELVTLGVLPVMLTGDNQATARAIAARLGMTELRAGLMPGDKADIIAELEATRGPTGMVGDGVNDAPALAAARVGVAMGGISSAAALETADVVLMADDLTALPWLIRHGRATLARVRQNIALSLGTKAIVLVLALFGMASLRMAVITDVGTSLLVTANALRLLRAGDRR